MLFRSNLSVCPLSLWGLYFYAVPSPPATNDGLAEEGGTHRTGGEDVTPGADGELGATGVGVMAGVADADAGPPADGVPDDTEPVAVVAEPVAAVAEPVAVVTEPDRTAPARWGSEPMASSPAQDAGYQAQTQAKRRISRRALIQAGLIGGAGGAALPLLALVGRLSPSNEPVPANLSYSLN